MESSAESTQNKVSKRPWLLTLLCILTFIFSGGATIMSLIGIFASNWLIGKFDQLIPGSDTYSTAFIIVTFLVMLIIWGLSLWGAILMFGRRKGGFVMYIIPNGLVLVVQIIMMISAFHTYFLIAALISILFIILYSTQVKYMKE
jgi:hypothetical protein